MYKDLNILKNLHYFLLSRILFMNLYKVIENVNKIKIAKNFYQNMVFI